MLFVITCTCILGPHHLIMYTCICYARYLALYMYRRVASDNPKFSCPDSSARTMVAWL